jgi:glycosyltransferase involved in cell wall biosynthesis
MACGKPVIACRSGGAPEVVLDGETGILVPPVNPEAIAESIVLLEADTAYRHRLGNNGRKWVESRFTRDQYINRVERIYTGLLQATCAAF